MGFWNKCQEAWAWIFPPFPVLHQHLDHIPNFVIKYQHTYRLCMLHTIRAGVGHTQHQYNDCVVLCIDSKLVFGNLTGANLFKVDLASFVYRSVHACQLVDLLLRLRQPHSNREVITIIISEMQSVTTARHQVRWTDAYNPLIFCCA